VAAHVAENAEGASTAFNGALERWLPETRSERCIFKQRSPRTLFSGVRVDMNLVRTKALLMARSHYMRIETDLQATGAIEGLPAIVAVISSSAGAGARPRRGWRIGDGSPR
jgi:hypothetical protein